MKGTHPSGHVGREHGGEDFAELFRLGLGVVLGTGAAEAVEMLVVVVFYVLGHGGEEGLLLTHGVLAATTGGTLRGGGFRGTAAKEIGGYA